MAATLSVCAPNYASSSLFNFDVLDLTASIMPRVDAVAMLARSLISAAASGSATMSAAPGTLAGAGSSQGSACSGSPCRR